MHALFINPRSGVKQSVLSVSQSSVCMAKKLKSRHIDPHKPLKGSQTIANSKTKMLYVYLTEVKGALFRCYFLLFITIHNIGSMDLFVPSRTEHVVHLETSCFEMTARKQYFPTIYVLYRRRDNCLSCFFQLFRNIWPYLFSFVVVYTVSGHSHTLDRAIHEHSIHEHSIRDIRCSSAEMPRRL